MDNAPSMQTFLGASGACPEIAWKGRTWRIGHPTQRAKAALEELVAAQAVREVIALKPVLPAAEYDELFRSVREAVTGKEYRTLGSGWSTVLRSQAGAHLFFLSLLRECHPDATEAEAHGLLAECGDEAAAALARVTPFFFDLLLDDPRVPQSQRAKLKEAMLNSLKPTTHSS